MKKILVADDEFDMLNSIELILSDEGYKVVTCSNGRDALKLCREVKPDLVITDVMMPQMTGFEFLKKAKEEGINDIPAIVMSAVRPSVPQSEIGWKIFLTKPFTIEQLVDAVHKTLAS